MSSFFSRKYLQYRQLLTTGAMETDDRPCPVCGYNLRGLPLGHTCPECGGGTTEEITTRPKGRRVGDLIAGGTPEERQRWRTGLTLAALCLVIFVFARWWLLIVGLGGVTANHIKTYLAIGAAASLLWATATILIMPGKLVEAWPWMRSFRAFVIVTQCLWLPAYALWAAQHFSPAGSSVTVFMLWQLGLRGFAAIGVLVMIAILRLVALHADLDPAARRMEIALWFLPIATLVPLIFPATIMWTMLGLLGLVLLIWSAMMMVLAYSIWEMRQHVAWTIRLGELLPGRDERIAQTRRELDAQVAARIRPVPHQPGTTPGQAGRSTHGT